MLTKQEIFDKALTGIRAQGKPGFGAPVAGARPTCKYRTPDPANPGVTLACGIGQLIPDELYDASFDRGDGVSVCRLIAENSAFNEAMRRIGIDLADTEVQRLLLDLQAAHDSAANGNGGDPGEFLSNFEARMSTLARRATLVYVPATVEA